MKLDRVLWHRELASALEIGRIMGEELVETGNSQWPLAVPISVSPQGRTVDFEPRYKDWQDADQLVVALFVPREAIPVARVRIDCGSHTPGLQGNDYMQCYYRYLHQGWGRLEFPYENMLIFGIPDRWHDVRRVRLSLSGEGGGTFLLAGLAIEKRERADGPRMTDEELFAELDLDHPGLELVRARWERGDLEGAKEALLDYFASRPRPRHSFPTRPALQPEYDCRPADLICRHFILGQQLGEEIDWRANPIGYLEWMHSFNRHVFMRTLVDAYLATGNEKYARELDYLLSSWMRVSPPPVGNNGGGDPAWETLSTAVRITGVWPAVWYALLSSPSFRPQTKIDMLKSFYEHAQHLLPYPTGHNWLVAESAALATVGILFPEFAKASKWREVGLERLEHEMRVQVYPDGVQFELTPGYHCMCINLFANVFELARSNGYYFSSSFIDRLESMFDYVMYVTRPDGTRPSLNDARWLDISSASVLRRGNGLFPHPEWLYVASGGQEGAPPPTLSHAFPYAGQYVMRTGWERDSLWAVVDAGPYGEAHQHEDKLSLELYAYGTRFVVDPGIASYLDDPWTHYFRSTAAHNTVMVDGNGQARGVNLPRELYRSKEPGEALWGSSSHLDFVWGFYKDGYRGLDSAASPTHKRLVLFVKPFFWVIWDLLIGQGEHELSALYHFEPMLIQYDKSSGVVRSNRLGMPNIEFLPVSIPQSVQVVYGESEPVQGWVARGGKVEPSPTVIYRCRGELPIAFGLVAAPFKSGVTSGLRVESVADDAAGEHLHVRVTLPDDGYYEIAFAEQPAEISCQGIDADAQGIVVRRRRGHTSYIAGLNCRQLRLDGAVLVGRDSPRPLVEVYLGDDL